MSGNPLARHQRLERPLGLGEVELLAARAAGDAGVATGELAPELLDERLGDDAHGVVRAGDRDGLELLPVPDDDVSGGTVLHIVEVVHEVVGPPQHHAQAGLAHAVADEGLGLDGLFLLQEVLAADHSVGTVAQDRLELLDCPHYELRAVGGRAVPGREQAVDLRPCPERGEEHVGGSVVGGALADPVWTLGVHPLGHLPEAGLEGLGLDAEERRDATEGVEVEVADADDLDVLTDAVEAVVGERARAGTLRADVVVEREQVARAHHLAAPVLGLDHGGGLVGDGGGEVVGVAADDDLFHVFLLFELVGSFTDLLLIFPTSCGRDESPSLSDKLRSTA